MTPRPTSQVTFKPAWRVPSTWNHWLTIGTKAAAMILALVSLFLARWGRAALPSLTPSQDPLDDIWWRVTAVPLSPSFDHTWLGYTCTSYLYLLPILIIQQVSSPSSHPWITDALMSAIGGILYIISGSGTINFYNPLVSTDTHPRDTGLALGSFYILTGVFLLINFLVIVYTLVLDWCLQLESKDPPPTPPESRFDNKQESVSPVTKQRLGTQNRDNIAGREGTNVKRRIEAGRDVTGRWQQGRGGSRSYEEGSGSYEEGSGRSRSRESREERGGDYYLGEGERSEPAGRQIRIRREDEGEKRIYVESAKMFSM